MPVSRKKVERAGRRIRKTIEGGGEPSAADLQILEEYRAAHLPALAAIQLALGVSLHGFEGTADPPMTARPKTREAIIAKMCRDKTALTRMQDIAGVRVVATTLEAQEADAAIVAGVLDPGGDRTKNTVAEGDKWGYRAIHIVGQAHGHPVEVQVRMVAQDRWAQVVEALDKAVGLDLKHGRGCRLVRVVAGTQRRVQKSRPRAGLPDTAHPFRQDDPPRMSHFLLIYHRAHRDQPTIRKFKDAAEALACLEKEEQTLDPEHGAVLLFADDEQDLRRTHGHYFTSLDDLLAV